MIPGLERGGVLMENTKHRRGFFWWEFVAFIDCSRHGVVTVDEDG